MRQTERAWVYDRVSTRRQRRELAPRELADYCRRRTWRLVERITDVGSGRRADLPGMRRLLAAARAGRVDVVVCSRLDRLGRSIRNLIDNVDELLKHGVCVVVVSQGLELDGKGSASARLLFHTLAAAAEFQRELIVENVQEGLDRARARGARLGRPRIGVPSWFVEQLKGERYTWPEIAGAVSSMLGRRVSVGACRRALERGEDGKSSDG